MNLVTSQFDKNDKSIQSLSARNGVLTKEIEAQKNKVQTLQAALENASSSFGEADSRTRSWQIQLNNAQADLNKMESELKANEDAIDRLGQEMEEAEEQTEDFAESLSDSGDMAEDSSGKFEKVGSVVAGVGTAIAAAAAAIGAVVVAASVELVKLGDEYNKAVNQISASTGATGTELEELGVIAQKVYTNNFGDSLEDVAEGLSVVQKTTGLVGDELQKATESGFALRDTFGYDLQESARATNALMKNFGVTAEEAYNIIAVGAQNGADQNGDLLDTLNEYSAQYSALGLSADQFVTGLINGAEAGVFSIDKVGDAVKEFNLRAKDGSNTTIEAFQALEGYESLFVISDSNKKEPGTDTILTLRPVHPWDRMNEEEFMQCIKGIVPNPAVQIEIETNKGSELYSSDYFDDLDLKPLLDYSWNNIKNIRKIDIDLTCEAYGFKGKGCIGILIKNGLPAEEIEILSKDVEIDGEIYTLSSNIKYKTNCITETSTSISVDEDGEIDTNTSWSERFKSKASLSIHGIEVPYNLFPDYSNRMSKAVLKIPFPFSFRLDIGVNSDLNLNSARDQIIYDEKWLTFEENLYRIICRRLKDTLSSSDWKILNEIIQKNNTDTFSRVANSFE